MKINSWLRFGLIVLCLSMAVSMFACGSGTTEPTTAPDTPTTEAPTQAPTETPTEEPTEEPTQAPTEEPTQAPTEEPTEEPTIPGEGCTAYEDGMHIHEADVTEPTCTEGGYTTYTCACGDTYTADTVKALGHTYESVTVKAT